MAVRARADDKGVLSRVWSDMPRRNYGAQSLILRRGAFNLWLESAMPQRQSMSARGPMGHIGQRLANAILTQ